jgi:hypothetical protein
MSHTINTGRGQTAFIQWDVSQKRFNNMVAGPNGPQRIVFPQLPRRTVWNANHPELHTIKSAVVYVIQQSTDKGLALSPPQVNNELIRMGFEPQLVVRTIQAILSKTEGINKCLVRHYPGDGSKSWSCYAFGWGANVIDKKHQQIAGWLNTDDHFKQTVQVIKTMAKGGHDHFTTKIQNA